jgi:large subunit ribosomal protein L12
MELIYAVLLLHKAGKEINQETLTKVAQAAGINADEAKIKSLVAALEGVDIDKAIKEAIGVGAVPSTENQPAQEKKEEKKEEKVDEAQSAAGLGALFG